MRHISAPRHLIAAAAAAATAAAVIAGASACGTASSGAQAARLHGLEATAASRAPADAVSARPVTTRASSAPRRHPAQVVPGGSAPKGTAAARTPAGYASTAPAAGANAAPATGANAAAATAVRRGLLREFTTVNAAGYFYTAYGPEASTAVSKFHFRATGATFGYLDSSEVKGTVPLYRLHLVGRQSYLVTPDVSEKNSLLASHKFTLDGILGFLTTKPLSGTFAIWRLSKNSYWRLATTAQEEALVKQGWHLDGPVGYVWSKA